MDSQHYDPKLGNQLGPYKIVDLLGKGRFAAVWRAVNVAGTNVALKIYRYGNTNATYFKNEASIFHRIISSQIARPEPILTCLDIFAHISSDSGKVEIHPCLVLSLHPESVSKLIKKYRKDHEMGLPVLLAKHITREVLRALKYLHSLNIIHTDVKPSNILMDTLPTDDNPLSLTVKLADYGSSTSADNLFSRRVGTTQYCAPELLLDTTYSFSADIWATCSTLFELVTSYPLFDVYDDHDINYGYHIPGDETSSSSLESQPLPSASTTESETHRLVYRHLIQMWCALGPPPETITNNGPIYFNPLGQLKNDPNVPFVGIKSILDLNFDGIEHESELISDFLYSGLRYDPQSRMTAPQLLLNKWLNDDDIMNLT